MIMTDITLAFNSSSNYELSHAIINFQLMKYGVICLATSILYFIKELCTQ